MREPVFLLALAMAAGTVLMIVKTIATAFQRAGSRSDLAQLKEQLQLHAAALDEAENSLAQQSSQIAELQERLDFTERLLAQGRDRSALGPGENIR
jgi:septal ring factor EnvC (AmiA/AmiB activator)